MNSEDLYPTLVIPRRCISLESDSENTDNIFIDVSIMSRDTEGSEMCVYSGFCSIKFADDFVVDRREISNTCESVQLVDSEHSINMSDNQMCSLQYPNQSQVWIDPCRSPYVYNQFDGPEPSEQYSTEQYSVHHENHTNHITVEQHNTTYITQNVYNLNSSEFEHKKFRKLNKDPVPQQDAYNLYEEDEFQCGVFLSQLPEEIMLEEECKARKERELIGIKSDNEALKQLMSTGIQLAAKQQKTILFLGHDAADGQTIQNIAVNDPLVECTVPEDIKLTEDSSDHLSYCHKKYQCDKCKQIFNQISAFRQHMVRNHKAVSRRHTSQTSFDDVLYICQKCGKKLRTKDKFDIHCSGHGDPDLECIKCLKVFASKFTLRTHSKIHLRKYPCDYCNRSYSDKKTLEEHKTKSHYQKFICDVCGYMCFNAKTLKAHCESHVESDNTTSIEEDFIRLSPPPTNQNSPKDESVIENVNSAKDGEVVELNSNDNTDVKTYVIEMVSDDENKEVPDRIKRADSVIAKVISNKVFMNSSKVAKHRKYNKVCDVCLKTFDRISDLKRHLIEHIIRSTLAKIPVSEDGKLLIQCEVCRSETFSRTDRYKAHLREHAKLTLYKCTFCDKNFSDSSNFSKHKKIHGCKYFQCDICQRKFNSKKMISQHMEYHKQNKPLTCHVCGKDFHFKSMLNKHLKLVHSKTIKPRFRCKFCGKFFQSLKDKWDHEWAVHNLRRIIADCKICGCKFRKYSELKRHCISVHHRFTPSVIDCFDTELY